MLAPDTILQNRYRIIRRLGQGGMGAVYEALDQRLSSSVALKETLVSPDITNSAFEREASLLANLRHPCLPVVTDYFIENDGQFLVMQLITGDDLAELLRRKGSPFPVDQVLEWADKLLDVLEYLHTRQPPIVHRDIKPSNLKLTEKGEIFLLDFGLAKGAAGQMATLLTSKSVLGYTPVYAPLEQIHGIGTDERSDLYSFGATLYHLFTGVLPTDARARFATIEDGRPDPLRLAHEINSNIPPAISSVLSQMMAVKKKDRPSSAGEIKKAFQDARKGVMPTPGPHTGQAASLQSTLLEAHDPLLQKSTLQKKHPLKGGQNFGPFVFKLCNRNQQTAAFNDFFITNLKKHPGIPQIYFIHGEERECHDSLVERIINTQIKPIADKKWGEQRSVIIHKKPRWVYEGDIDSLMQELKHLLFMEFDPTYIEDELSAEALSNLASSQLSPLIILQHNIHAERWNKQTKELVKWYLTYWAEFKGKSSSPQFIIFLNIIYPKEQVKAGWKKWLGRKGFDKNHIQEEIRAVSESQGSRCPCLVLKELSPPGQHDVGDWFSRYNIYDTKVQTELVGRIFEKGRGQVSMADIEHELRKIHQSFIKERGHI